MKKRNNSFKIIALSALFITLSAISADFCVSTTPELNNALFASGANNQNDVIRIKQGTYIVETKGFFGLGFQYLTAVNENFDLEISGGWSEFFGNPCGQQLSNPNSTILDGDGLKRVLLIETRGDVTIENLQIANGFFPTGMIDGEFTNAGGLRVLIFNNNLTVSIERMFFINNQAHHSGALHVLGGGRVYLKNNLFVANRVEGFNAVATLGVSENYAINNTVMFNNGGGIHPRPTAPENKVFIANNLIWENDSFDLILSGAADTEVYLYNNNIESMTGSNNIILIESNNISQTPQFETGILNFTPITGSPLINAGKSAPLIVPVPPQFQFSWNYGSLDFEGNDRVINGKVDIGAFEAPSTSLPDFVFANSFE